VLLERNIELGLVEAFLDSVRGGEGGIMVLEGPPGIGKTALLEELEERAKGRGIEVLHARASQLDHGFSFGVARQLLEQRVRAAAPAEREALLGGAAMDGAPALGIAGDGAVETSRTTESSSVSIECTVPGSTRQAEPGPISSSRSCA
jgi:predicted ATPase